MSHRGRGSRRMMDRYLRGYLSGTLLCPSSCMTVACQPLCLGLLPCACLTTVAGGHVCSGCFTALHLQHPLLQKPPALRNPLISLLITRRAGTHRQPGQAPHILTWALLAFGVKGSPEPFPPWGHSHILSPLQTAASSTQRAACPAHAHVMLTLDPWWLTAFNTDIWTHLPESLLLLSQTQQACV